MKLNKYYMSTFFRQLVRAVVQQPMFGKRSPILPIWCFQSEKNGK